MKLSSKDLDFILTLDDTILKRYCSSLSPDAQSQFTERLSRWRDAGPQVSDAPALAMYRRGLERVGAKKPPPPPPKTYEQKQFDAATAEAAIVEDARENIETFVEYILDKPLARHHKIWLANIFHPDRMYINLCAPPGSAKTSMVTAVLAFILGKFPVWTNAIISVSEIQATARLGAIKFMIQYNERYHNVFPHIKIDDNRDNTKTAFSVWDTRMTYPQWVTLLQRQGHPLDPSLFAAGAGSTGIIGRRWSGYCMIDDMVDQQMLTEPLMKEAFDFVAVTLLSRLDPGIGRAVNIGTRWMANDLIERLQKNPEWYTVTIPAIWYDDESNPHSYWPEVWTLELLAAKKRSMSDDGSETLFELMYMANPQASAAALFTAEHLRRDLPEDYRRRLVDIYITTDWALKVQERNDFTVFLAVGLDAEGNFYVLDMLRLKMGLESSPQALADFTKEIADRYGFVSDIIIESVAFQDAIGLLFEKANAVLPYSLHKPVGNKGHRATLVSDAARSGRLYINQQINQLHVLTQEWLHFGTAKHDDTLDPMGLLIQYLGMSQMSATVTMFQHPALL